MIFHWKLVVFFILAATATIGSCRDFCGTGSMYFVMVHSFFDVLKASEQVCGRFRAPKDNERRLHAYPGSLGAVRPVLHPRSAWADHCGGPQPQLTDGFLSSSVCMTEGPWKSQMAWNQSINRANTFQTSKNGCPMQKYIDPVPQKSPQLTIVAEGSRIKKNTR